MLLTSYTGRQKAYDAPSDKSPEHRRHDVLSFYRRHRCQTTNHDSKRRWIREATYRKCSYGLCPRGQHARLLEFTQLLVGDEFVDNRLQAYQGADCFALLPGHTHDVAQRDERLGEDELQIQDRISFIVFYRLCLRSIYNDESPFRNSGKYCHKDKKRIVFCLIVFIDRGIILSIWV